MAVFADDEDGNGANSNKNKKAWPLLNYFCYWAQTMETVKDDQWNQQLIANTWQPTPENQEHTTNIDSDPRQSTFSTRQPTLDNWQPTTYDKQLPPTNTVHPKNSTIIPHENVKIHQSGWKLAKNVQYHHFAKMFPKKNHLTLSVFLKNKLNYKFSFLGH